MTCQDLDCALRVVVENDEDSRVLSWPCGASVRLTARVLPAVLYEEQVRRLHDRVWLENT